MTATAILWYQYWSSVVGFLIHYIIARKIFRFRPQHQIISIFWSSDPQFGTSCGSDHTQPPMHLNYIDTIFFQFSDFFLFTCVPLCTLYVWRNWVASFVVSPKIQPKEYFMQADSALFLLIYFPLLTKYKTGRMHNLNASFKETINNCVQFMLT